MRDLDPTVLEAARAGAGWAFEQVYGQLAGAVHHLTALLDHLTPEQRDVLLLRFVAGLALEEVAETKGRSVGAVKAMQHRALASMRRVLEESPLGAVSPLGEPTLTTT